MLHSVTKYKDEEINMTTNPNRLCKNRHAILSMDDQVWVTLASKAAACGYGKEYHNPLIQIRRRHIVGLQSWALTSGRSVEKQKIKMK